jgi:hypothetical protein
MILMMIMMIIAIIIMILTMMMMILTVNNLIYSKLKLKIKLFIKFGHILFFNNDK